MNIENIQQNTTEIEGIQFQFDENGFVNFGDVARSLLNQQSQYASRYVDGQLDGRPNLGKDLRFEGSPMDYHDLKIHKDDIQEFVDRVKQYREES